MTEFLPSFSTQLLCVLLAAMPSRADNVKTTDPDLPQPLDLSFSKELVENSPFTRAINLNESLQLTGVAFIDGRPVVTIRDRDAKKTHLISETTNTPGWKLVSATPGSGSKRTEARILIGSEVVNLQYFDTQIVVEKRSGSSSGRYMIFRRKRGHGKLG